MKQKEEKIKLIIKIMKENGIVIGDILTGMKRQELIEIRKKDDENKAPLDLLCKMGNFYRRVPFEIGKKYEVLGIFPSLSNEYILTKQATYRDRKHVNETRLVTIDLWQKINKILPDLNNALKEIKEEEIYGFYFANKTFNKCIIASNPIISVVETSSSPSEFRIIAAADSCLAKTLYFGIFDPLKNLPL